MLCATFDAGDPPVRFGREGERIPLLLSSLLFALRERLLFLAPSHLLGRGRNVYQSDFVVSLVGGGGGSFFIVILCL
jgi:hypothetical protein